MAIRTIIDENGFRDELADSSGVEIRGIVTVSGEVRDDSGQRIGAQGPVGGPNAYQDLASTFGMHPTASAAVNTAAYWTWMSSSVYNFHTLVLDVQGTYSVNANSIAVPAFRTLKGVPSVTIKAVTSGTWTVAPFSSPATVESLTIDANGCTRYGTFTSSSSPPSAGATMFLKGVTAKNALSASVFTFCSYLGIDGLSTSGSPIGILAESASELTWKDISNSFHSDACIRCVGSAARPEYGTQHNGGRVAMFKVVQALCDFGIDFEGVGEASVHSVTCEGANVASIKMGHGSTNMHVFGSRTNAGLAVEFSGSRYCEVIGGAVNTQNVLHRGGGHANRAYLKAESSLSTSDILNVFSSSTGLWHAYCRPDGYITLSGSAPTQGSWMAQDKVWRLPVAGQSMGYACSAAGAPGTWVSMSNWQ